MSGIVDTDFSDLQTSTRNLSGIVDTDLSDLQTSTRNLSSILDGSTNYPNTIVTNTFAGNSQLAADLDANGNSIANCAAVSGHNGILDLSSLVLIFTSQEGGPRIGPDRLNTATWTKSKIEKAASSYNYSLSAWETVKDNSGTWGGGGGGGSYEACAIASAVTIGNTSSVSFSGTDGAALDIPTDGMVPVLDTAAARIKYQKLRGISIAEGAVQLENLADGAVDDSKLANSLNINSHIAANNIGFGKLTLVGSRTIIGNANETLNGPMDDLSRDDARNILGLSAGTVAPQYTSLNPSAGDLWYNTDDDELYTYDAGRGHWLGAPYYISFGKANAATASGVGHYLYVGHQGTTATTSERGWLVPHDMVITGWRGHTQSTFTGWNARVDKNSGGTNTTGIVQTGVQGAVDTFSDFTLDVDVAAGDILGVALVLGSVTLNNSTVTVKIQRKGA